MAGFIIFKLDSIIKKLPVLSLLTEALFRHHIQHILVFFLIFAGCLHDLFKHDTQQINPKNGFVTCPGHDTRVASFIRSNTIVQEWITSNGGDVETVASLCKDHMRFHQFGDMKKSKQDEFRTRPHWGKLIYLGAADNMLEEFDPNNLEKSWKWKEKVKVTL